MIFVCIDSHKIIAI